jgi:hypothetical protein
MTRSLKVVSVLVLGLLAWIPGRAAAQAHLLGGPAPEIAAGPWINSSPLTLGVLRGRVVLMDFWTSG